MNRVIKCMCDSQYPKSSVARANDFFFYKLWGMMDGWIWILEIRREEFLRSRNDMEKKGSWSVGGKNLLEHIL